MGDKRWLGRRWSIFPEVPRAGVPKKMVLTVVPLSMWTGVE